MLRSKYCALWLMSAFAVCSAPVDHAQSSNVDVSSPDHRITMHFGVQLKNGQGVGKDGQLVYSVSFNGKQAFEDSSLRL